MEKLTPEHGATLVKIARAVISSRLGESLPEPKADDPALTEKWGTFVTLKLDNQLRGCIGNIEPVSPVVEGVRENSIHAAFNDYRFSPLTPEELPKVVISVSVLTPAKPLGYSDAADLLTRLRPGKDGVVLRHGGKSATFLPQVWQQLATAEQFLRHLCLKAGLAGDFWRQGDVEILTYQVQNFSESEQ